MVRLQVSGMGRDTRRKRKRTYVASSADAARKQADADGIDVAEVVELPPEPPTENQIANFFAGAKNAPPEHLAQAFAMLQKIG